MKFVPSRGRENNRWIVQAWPRELERQYYRDAKVRAAELPSASNSHLVPQGEEYKETGRSTTFQHLENFFSSVRSRKPTVQDVWAGHRAAACAHLLNDSAENERIAHWDFSEERQKA